MGDFEEYTHHRDLIDDMKVPLILAVITGVLAYGVFGVVLHCAHINDRFARTAAQNTTDGWSNFLRAQAKKGIKDLPKDLVEALEEGETNAVQRLAAETPLEERRALLMKHIKQAPSDGTWRLILGRDTLFEDVMANLRSEVRQPRKIHVEFHDEMGLDWGGLTRELFTMFGQELGKWGSDTKPMKRLWKSAGAQNRFQPEPCAVEVHGVEEASEMYRAVGRFCGIAISTEHLVDFSFAGFFWKRVLKKDVSMEENLDDLDRVR